MNTTTLRRIAGRTVLVLAAAATALVASTATAQAASAARITFAAHDNGFNVLTYTAGGDGARLVVTRSGNTVIFKDSDGARILSDTDRCHENVLAGQVQCSATGLSNIRMIGSAGSDTFFNQSGITSRMIGLGGEDIMQGQEGIFDWMEGGADDDFFFTHDTGANPYDYVQCGAGTGDEWAKDAADGSTADCEIIL